MAFTKVADFALFGMEDLQTPTDAIPLPIDDMASLRSGVTYIFKGLPIYVEYVKGEERTGKAPDGKEWSQICPTAYGYIPKTKDADGEDIDITPLGNAAFTECSMENFSNTELNEFFGTNKVSLLKNVITIVKPATGRFQRYQGEKIASEFRKHFRE